MAHRNFRPLNALTAETVVLDGQITIGASGAVATQADARSGFSVARSEAGTYVVTFAQRYAALAFAAAEVVAADALGTNEVIRPTTDLVSNETVTFKNVDMTTPAAVDPASGDIIKFFFVLRNSTTRR